MVGWRLAGLNVVVVALDTQYRRSVADAGSVIAISSRTFARQNSFTSADNHAVKSGPLRTLPRLGKAVFDLSQKAPFGKAGRFAKEF